MLDVNAKDFNEYGMPVHDPLRTFSNFHFASEVVNIDYTVENPDAIASIVPPPLQYSGNGMCIGFVGITELKGDVDENAKPWQEISLRVPVTLNGQPKTYLCVVYTDMIQTVIVDREALGIAKVPALVSVERNGCDFNVELAHHVNKRRLLNFVFKADPPAKRRGPGGRPRRPPGIVIFKHIPSPSLKNVAQVKQLLEIKYSKASLGNVRPGQGSIEFLEAAPRYLKEAGIVEVTEAIYHELEMEVDGAELLHDYLQEGDQQGRRRSLWRRLLGR